LESSITLLMRSDISFNFFNFFCCAAAAAADSEAGSVF